MSKKLHCLILPFQVPNKCTICTAHHYLDVLVEHVLVEGRSEWPLWTLPALLITFFSVSKVVVCLFFLFRICKYDDAKIKMVQAELDAQVFISVDESVVQDEFH